MDQSQRRFKEDVDDPLLNDTYETLNGIFWSLVQGDPKELEEIVTSNVYRLLREGPAAFERWQDPLLLKSKEKVMESEAYNAYVDKYFRGKIPKYQNNNPMGTTPRGETPQPDLNDSRSSFDSIRSESPEKKLNIDNTFEDTIKVLRGQEKLDYDKNFSSILVLKSDEHIKKELLISNIVNQHKDHEFIQLFQDLRPLMFDVIKRREDFVELLQVLRRLSSRQKIKCAKTIKSLEVKDLLVLLIESCSVKSMAKLGSWLTNQFYPLPIFYPIGQNQFYVNLDCCSEVLFHAGKKLITSIGTKSSVQKGKSSLLRTLFSTKEPGLFSSKNGFTHRGSIDLYVKLPQEGFEYLIADVNGYTEDKQYHDIISKLVIFSQLVILHVFKEDFKDDEANLNLVPIINELIPKTTKFIILFRDYDDDKDADMKNNISKSMETFPNCLEIIPINKLSDKQGLDIGTHIHDAMQHIQEILEKLEQNPLLPLFEVKKAYEFNKLPDINGPLMIESELDKENRLVTKLLENISNNAQGKNLFRELFPCFWNDYLLNEELREKEIIEKKQGNPSLDQSLDLKFRYQENMKLIKSYEAIKSQIEPSKLMDKISTIISSNDITKILLLSETLESWKKPIFTPLKEKYLDLSAQKRKAPEEKKSDFDDKIKQLQTEMDDKDISLDTFLDEIYSLYEAGKLDNNFGIDGIKEYIKATLLQGGPINLVNGKTLKYGSKLLKEIFWNLAQLDKKVYVISIIGAQSSAKSTLLNILFGCGFVTSAGRCTKGLYISLLDHPIGFHVAVIDTEGLLSVVARDQEFDNLITTMTFCCSHLVIINNKGEVNTKLRDLLEICVYAMKYLKLTNVKPKVIFALRDIIDDKFHIQQQMLITMKSSIEDAARKLQIDMNNLIDISEKDMFLFPPAFQTTKNEQNGAIVLSNNNLFSQKVLEMRNYIFNYLASIEHSAIFNLKLFYNQTEMLWYNLTKHGKDIMKAKNFLEIQLKEEALEKVNQIFKKHNKDFLINTRPVLLNHKELLESNKCNSDSFVAELKTSFGKVVKKALDDLDNEIIQNERYMVVSNCHREFTGILEFYLGWQNQNLLHEWRAYIISHETKKEIAAFKYDLKTQVNEIISKNYGNSVTQKEDILRIFARIKDKLNADFSKRLDTLHKDNLSSLVQEIHTHFECALHRRSRKEKMGLVIPSIIEMMKQVEEGKEVHDRKKWLNVSNIKPDNNIKDNLDINEDFEEISNQFEFLQNDLRSIITEKSSEETAFNILTACIVRVTQMEMNGLPFNFASFIHSCILQAMYAQYTKTRDHNIAKIRKMEDELKAILIEEEKHLVELLDQTQNNFDKGEKQAKKCYDDIQKKFCEIQEVILQNAVMQKINDEFPAPESANTKAYQNSFEISNYINVVKYVLNINKFIREIYDQKIKIIAEDEIDQRLNVMKNKFIEIIHDVINVADSWSKENQNKDKVDLSSLFLCAQKNPKLTKYFPELYSLELDDVNAFTLGFTKTLAHSLTSFEIDKQIKNFIQTKVEEYLNNQYKNLVGCQARCPLCNNKCTRPDPNHVDHHTNCHFLAAFRGVREKKTRHVVLKRCCAPENYQCRWEHKDIEFEKFDDLINKIYPEWRAEFPTKEQPEKHEGEISQAMIECWVATKDVLIEHYRYKDKTPESWENKVEKERRLKKDLTIEGYNDAKKKKK